MLRIIPVTMLTTWTDSLRANLDWVDLQFLERPVLTWIFATAAFLLVVMGVPIIRAILRRKCREAEGASPTWRGLVGRLNDKWLRFTTLVIGFVCGTLILAPEPRIEFIATGLLIVVLAFQLCRLIPVVIDWAIGRLAASAGESAVATQATVTTLKGLRWVILFIAYAIILLLTLQNLGVNVTAMIAGLGIGGIAIALAMQNVLTDLFASLTIALDKPFVAGDFIVVGSEMGSIEHVGLKTTRVRSLSGEQLVFANSDLLSSRIRNYKRMSERRVVFAFGVVYSTTPEVLEAIPAIVKEIIQTQKNVRFDRCHFHRFGGSSLDFEAVYYIASPDFNAHMDAQQAVHLGIARAFRDRTIDFAFPTQTLHIASLPPAPEEAAPQKRGRPGPDGPPPTSQTQ